MTVNLDEGSFERLFRELFPSLMVFALKILASDDDAREVVQNVFINLWERREDLDLSTSLKSYLFTSVHNRSLNLIRDNRKFARVEIPEWEGDPDPGTRMESEELEERIMEVIGSLPEKCRVVFTMNRFDGLKYGEIAERLGISVKTVENQMSKALKILRQKLAGYLTLLVWFILQSLN